MNDFIAVILIYSNLYLYVCDVTLWWWYKVWWKTSSGSFCGTA